MQEEPGFTYSKYMFRVPLLVVFLMWFVYWLEIRFGYNFTNYGVYPRTVSGLKGVLFSPFIHGDTKHLFNNSVPVFVFLTMLFYFYEKISFPVLVYGSVLTGLLTWCIGKEAYHIGMSGVVYLLFSFIFFSGVFRKYFRLIAVSFIVIFLYGSMFWYIFPVEKGVSWEGHLSGLLTGLFFAVLFRKKGPQQKAYTFTQTEFDLLFDDNGNFNPPKEEEEAQSTTPEENEEV